MSNKAMLKELVNSFIASQEEFESWTFINGEWQVDTTKFETLLDEVQERKMAIEDLESLSGGDLQQEYLDAREMYVDINEFRDDLWKSFNDETKIVNSWLVSSKQLDEFKTDLTQWIKDRQTEAVTNYEEEVDRETYEPISWVVDANDWRNIMIRRLNKEIFEIETQIDELLVTQAQQARLLNLITHSLSQIKD